MYCFFGKTATDSYTEMAVDLYNCDWHALPIDLQKYFILMISNLQRPLEYHGFRIAVLNLQTFNQVSKMYICEHLMTGKFTIMT